jgi:2-polyprenyl-3-methyl-5-hydroxy-6-metoxy-1,4-benzoquinol methylase
MNEYYDDILFHEAYTIGRIPFYSLPQHEDIKLYLNIAKQYSVKSILDVGCGIGRLSIPLSEKAFEVTAIDNIKTVIDAAQKRSSKVEWVCANINELNLNKRFDLIILSLDFINHFHHSNDLMLILKSIQTQLSDTGLIIIDTIHPSLNFLTRSANPQKEELSSIFEDPHGRGLVYVTQKRYYHYPDQILNLSKCFHFHKEHQQMSIALKFRIYFPKELATCLTQSGFSIEKIMGNFDGSEFNDCSPKMIFMASKI